MKLKIIIPMAGRGSRFKDKSLENSEYAKPKPLISVMGKPMVWWAVTSLPFVNLPNRPAKTNWSVTAEDLIFIVLQEHEDNYQATQHLKSLFGEKITIILIPEVTRGAAETVFIAEPYMSDSDSFIALDSDNLFDGTPLAEEIERLTPEVSGIIPVFTPPDQEVKFSYALSKNGIVSAVAEKDPILAAQGADAILGAYFFSSWILFKKEVLAMIELQKMYGPQGKKEFYIAPIYQKLINKQYTIRTAKLTDIKAIGTPADLEKFLKEPFVGFR